MKCLSAATAKADGIIACPFSANASSDDVNTEKVSKKVNGRRLLGVVPSFYCKTLVGLIHGIASSLALLCSLLTIPYFLYGNVENTPTFVQRLRSVCLLSNLLSSLLLGIFFWKHMASFTLATTPASQHGHTPAHVRWQNQGRLLVLTAQSTLPLVWTVSDACKEQHKYFLQVTLTVIGLACAAIGYYRKQHGTSMLVPVYGVVEIVSWPLTFLFWDLRALEAKYPFAREYVENQACVWIAIFQWGFLWYYLHTRKMCTTEFARLMCGGFHTMLLFMSATKWLAWEIVSPILLGRAGWWSHLPLTLYMYAFIQLWPQRRPAVRRAGFSYMCKFACFLRERFLLLVSFSTLKSFRSNANRLAANDPKSESLRKRED